VVVADDEPAARRGVRQLFAAFDEFEIVGECRNGEEALAALDAQRPDVLFLDVQMPRLGGFELIHRRAPASLPAIVFLTAYDHYAIDAFAVQALDYLVKPVTRVRFAATVQRLTRHLQQSERAASTILMRTSAGIMIVSPRDIDWIEAADNYARVWIGKRSYLIRQSLRELEERLLAEGFVRAHRCALVRLERIRALTGDVAVLHTGVTIPISRRQRATFVAALRDASL